MTIEEECRLKDALKLKFSFEETQVLTRVITEYECEGSYMQTAWRKGLLLAWRLDEAGYKIVKK